MLAHESCGRTGNDYIPHAHITTSAETTRFNKLTTTRSLPFAVDIFITPVPASFTTTTPRVQSKPRMTRPRDSPLPHDGCTVRETLGSDILTDNRREPHANGVQRHVGRKAAERLSLGAAIVAAARREVLLPRQARHAFVIPHPQPHWHLQRPSSAGTHSSLTRESHRSPSTGRVSGSGHT